MPWLLPPSLTLQMSWLLLQSLTWLEDFVFEFGDDRGHELRVRVREERHRGHQRTTVEVYHILRKEVLRTIFSQSVVKEEVIPSIGSIRVLNEGGTLAGDGRLPVLTAAELSCGMQRGATTKHL
jgi:hypothetical protein